MIVARVPGGLRLVRQVDHQDQCRAAADAWGNGAFARIDPWEPLARAAAVHDEGWRAWEDAPRVGSDGAPIDFPHIDRPTHVGLYRAGIASAAAIDPRVGLVVSMHGEGLYRSRLGLDGPARPLDELVPVARTFVADQGPLQRTLRAAIDGVPDLDDWAWSAYRLLQAWDALSLYLTWRGLPDGRTGRLPAVPRGPGDPAGVDLTLTAVDARTAACDPFPFAGAAAELPVAARTVPDRSYATDGDLRAALAEAEPETIAFRVVPA